MTKILNIMLLAFTIGTTSAVWAGSSDMEEFQCGTQAIVLGMSPADIKATCGQQWKPAYISKHTRPAVGMDEAAKTDEDHFEKWMYRTAGHTDTHVILKNGEVIRIFTMVQQ